VRQEEHAMIWSMSKDERDAYLAEKKAQQNIVLQEKARQDRLKAKRKERNDMIVAILVAVAMFSFGLFMMILVFMELSKR